jgi:hypothetical protein
MLRAQLLCLLIVVSLECISQGYINTKKTFARKYLKEYALKEKLKTSISETDSTILFLIRDTSVQNYDLTLYYDNTGKCFKELHKFTCDSCLNKTLNKSLNHKRYKWVKVSDTEYLSSFSKKRFLKKSTAPDYSFTVERFGMPKQEYKDLLKKVK